MILVFGGTTEGRIAARVLDGAGKPYLYSTLGDFQKIDSPNAVQLSGMLDYDAMSDLVRRREVDLIVDAAHPFAGHLHETIARVSAVCGVPVIRLERRFPPRDGRLIWCDSYDDAVEQMLRLDVKRLLALTGVRTIPKLRRFWVEHDCVFRILDRDESRREVVQAGFPLENVIYYRPGQDEGESLDIVRPDAVITKESGESGGFVEKVDAALERGINVFVVKRPVLPAEFIVVEGEVTLRRAVERLLPGFFPLRSGLTTGTCATAAVTAAILTVLDLDFSGKVEVVLPVGETVEVDAAIVEQGDRYAVASVVKDAGDDPDVTNGRCIIARVELSDRESEDIRFFGGEGVGVVTLPGLGLEPGEPAINPVPRKMMVEAVRRIYPVGGVDITVSVPGGEELARRTFNDRVGVQGGISIIGTSGVVRPFSNEAFVEAVTREIEVAVATGCERLVVNSGAKSEKSVRSLYPSLPPRAFVHYGNAIGETLKAAFRLGINRITVGLMIGKAVKLAAGHLDTHSHKVAMDRGFLRSLAVDAGCSDGCADIISDIDMARQLWNVLEPKDADKFFPALLTAAAGVCRSVFPEGEIETVIIDDNGAIRYRMKI